MKLREIAALLNGEIRGDPETEITGARGIDDGPVAGEITYAASSAFMAKARDCAASCVVVKEFSDDLAAAQLAVEDPHLAFITLLLRFNPSPRWPDGIDENAVVDNDARIAEGVTVMAFAYVSAGVSIGTGTVVCPGVFIGQDSRIGEACLIHPGVMISDKVQIGNRVIINANTVVGSEGFGYIQRGGKHIKVPQVGGVMIGDDVEIGSNVSIDRATTGMTEIGSGTKVDNLVQIAHNVKIGENAILVGQCGVAGSVKIGRNTIVGGQAAIADHVSIADGTILVGRTGVTGDIKKRGVYSGMPPIPHREWRKAAVLFGRLPELYNRIRELENKIREIQGRDGS